jgi:hypothetical protein
VEGWSDRCRKTSLEPIVRYRNGCQYGFEFLAVDTEQRDAIQRACDILPLAMGNRNILLPCRNIAEKLRCEAMTVSRYSRFAIDAGILEVQKAHVFRGNAATSEATEFRFNFSRVARSETQDL